MHSKSVGYFGSVKAESKMRQIMVEIQLTQYQCGHGIQVVFNSTLHSTLSLPVCATMSIVLESPLPATWNLFNGTQCNVLSVFFNNVENSFRPMICTQCALLHPKCDERISFWIPRTLASMLFIQISALKHFSAHTRMMSKTIPFYSHFTRCIFTHWNVNVRYSLWGRLHLHNVCLNILVCLSSSPAACWLMVVV